MTLITLGCIIAGIATGSRLRRALPEHHLREDSKDAIKVGTGFIAMLTAMVLGLLVGSAKSSFDAINAGLVQSGTKAIMLDRALAQYGSETDCCRRTLRCALGGCISRYWPEEAGGMPAELMAASATAPELSAGLEQVHESVRKLAPPDDAHRVLQSQAVQICSDVTQLRWQLLEQAQQTLPTPLLVALICWLTILFACFSLLAPRNATVMGVLLLCAVSVSGAIYLLLEMETSITGLMKVSCAPLVKAVTLMGQ